MTHLEICEIDLTGCGVIVSIYIMKAVKNINPVKRTNDENLTNITMQYQGVRDLNKRKRPQKGFKSIKTCYSIFTCDCLIIIIIIIILIFFLNFLLGGGGLRCRPIAPAY